jgi:transposase
MKLVQLTAGQEARLQAELRDSESVQVYRRAAALLAAHQGRSAGQVAALLGVTRQTVYNWLNTYAKEERGLDLADAPRSGRPSVWTEELDKLLEATLGQSPSEAGHTALNWTTTLLRKRLASCSSIVISDETLRRRLRQLGYTWKRGRYVLTSKVPKLAPAPAGQESEQNLVISADNAMAA